jgi:hypothetical protein
MFAAMRRASSRVIRCAAERPPGSSLEVHVGERIAVIEALEERLKDPGASKDRLTSAQRSG